MSEFQVLAKLLLLRNLITEDLLDNVKKKLNRTDNFKTFEEILIDDYKIDRDKIYSEVAKLYAIPKKIINFSDLSENEIEEIKNLLEALPKSVKQDAYEKKVIPFKVLKRKNDSLLILSAVPTDSLVKIIATHLKLKRYEVIYCPYENINEIIQHIISTEENEYLKILGETEQDMDVTSVESAKEEDQEELIEQEINKGALVYLFEAALVEAVKMKVSDIHVIPFDNKNIDILFRVDGKLSLWKRKDNINPQAFLAVVKDRSNNVDRFKIDEAQDGFIQRVIEEHVIRFRVSILPLVSKESSKFYESIVIRVLDDRNVITSIDLLGFLPQARKDFESAVNQPQGLVIVTGPTGSGKSTTLLATLYHVMTPEKNILTVEDPVEYVVKGARQIKISFKLDFSLAIRAILRHDPDIVMVGEIRDKETAETAMKLANTGHLTFSTLHTNDAPSAVSRLYKMNIETFLIAYAINIIVAQRLVRKLCDLCKKPVTEEKIDALIEQGIPMELIEQKKIFQSVGCDKCRNTGYKGRLGIHEVLYFTKEIRAEIVNSKSDINEERLRSIAKSQGMLSLRESGIELVKKGLTTLEEVLYTTTIN